MTVARLRLKLIDLYKRALQLLHDRYIVVATLLSAYRTRRTVDKAYQRLRDGCFLLITASAILFPCLLFYGDFGYDQPGRFFYILYHTYPLIAKLYIAVLTVSVAIACIHRLPSQQTIPNLISWFKLLSFKEENTWKKSKELKRQQNLERLKRREAEEKGRAAYATHHFGEGRDEQFNRTCLRCGKKSGQVVRHALECIVSPTNIRTDMNDNILQPKLEHLCASYPELPVVPHHSLEYEGWFNEAFSRIRLRSKHRTLEEQGRLLSLIADLHKQYQQICETRMSINRMSTEDLKRRMQNEKDLIELQTQLAKAQRERDLVTNPPKPSEAEKVRENIELLKAQTEHMRQQVEHAKAKAEFEALKHSPPRPEPRREEDPVEKLKRTFAEQQSARYSKRREAEDAEAEIMRLAEEIASQAPNQDSVF